MSLLFLCFLVQCLFGQVRPSCLRLPEVNPKRYVSNTGETLSLTIAQTDRISHRLVSTVFHIFLKEVLGYANVTLLKPHTQAHYREELSYFHNKDEITESPPRFMVDLEFWIPPEQAMSADMFRIRECGNIGPPGRYGWFMTKLPNTMRNYSMCMDHWNTFTSPKTAKLFSQDKERFLKYVIPGEHCTADYCKNYIYTPKWCETNVCALLLAGDFESTSFVVSHIEVLKLYVEVIWVGRSLRSLIISPPDPSRPLIFLDYTPSERVLPNDNRYSLIVFPPCEALNTTTCEYEAHRLAKLTWNRLPKAAKLAYESLQKINFRKEDYQELLSDYVNQIDGGESESLAIQNSACAWMHNHSQFNKTTSWSHWQPRDEDKLELLIGGIFPLSTNRFVARGIVGAAILAQQDVNNSTDILRDYKLTLLIDDGMCQADIVMKTFIEYIFQDQYTNLVGILGPACSESVEPLAGVSKHFKTVVISYSAEGSSFSDRQKYPYFFRTIGENKQYKFVYLELLKYFKWKQVASLTEDGTKYTEYITHTQVLLQKNGIAFTVNRKFPQDWQLETMSGFMDDLRGKNARIIIADVQEEAARAVMCQAFKLGMTAHTGWIWFLPPWLSPNWYNTTRYNTTRGEQLECTTEQILEAIDGHLSLSHSFFAPNDTVTQQNITVGHWLEKYKAECKRSKTMMSNYAGFTYDAYWTYAYALDKLLKENQSFASDIHSVNATMRLVEIIQKTDFIGVTGRIYFGDGPSRHSTVNVLQWLNKKPVIVGTFHPNLTDPSSGGRLFMEKEKPVWLEGKIPWDGSPPTPRCLVNGLANFLNTDCEVAIVVANIIGFGFVGVILIIGFIIVKHRYDKKVQLTKKYMKSLGIDLLSPSTLESLDRWEIPRDRVVINRKLGEGAFGTVYGGEAHFTEKGWVAVAVKTLKVGSTTEEKLDFLSEAEVMKRFDHKNIVGLLGVCTKNEPVYTVMEFMLYGDLKTFLLARRHLVNEKNAEESDEISSKKLTSMALDVARALSYLAELKYVHRDVASRNCLVNASRVVKLGDFGMTRPMFENDYYKFNRKGMLPVRWMAPESLALGIFTPASDVWSYGVLLYEIITFGSFPFQGLSNNQVLEHVKAGNTITIPSGVKPLLENLIRCCWDQEYRKRPKASELVEYIANNPRLLSACLDVPLSSVQIEDTGQLEIQLPQPRKFSLTLRNRSSVALNWGVADTSAQPLLPAAPPPIPLKESSSPTRHDYQQDSLL